MRFSIVLILDSPASVCLTAACLLGFVFMAATGLRRLPLTAHEQEAARQYEAYLDAQQQRAATDARASELHERLDALRQTRIQLLEHDREAAVAAAAARRAEEVRFSVLTG
jgi:hypothetical protein